MPKDPNTELNMSEFLDSLERGKRTYECFKHAIEIAQRLANHEQVERELIGRVAIAQAEAVEAERTRDAVTAQCERSIQSAREASLTTLGAIKKNEADAIAELRKATQEKADAYKATLADLEARVEAKKSELASLTKQSAETANEIQKIEKQLINVREAKRALLEA